MNKAAQPFIVSGSGTLGMDMVAASMIEEGEKVLMISVGTFGNNFARCLQSYRAELTSIVASPGEVIASHDVEKLLGEMEYSMVVVTHTETSTGFRNDIEKIARSVRKFSPSMLIVVDGVCSVGVEDLRFDEWDLDIVITCSQKVMRSYEAKRACFATLPSQLIHALNCALTQILDRPLQERFNAHRKASAKVKDRLTRLGLEQVVRNPKHQAHAMTAVYLPPDVDSRHVLQKKHDAGFYLAAGIHPELGSRYIRFGHMGVSFMDESRDEIDKALDMLEIVLTEMGNHMTNRGKDVKPTPDIISVLRL
ncbi:MAG: hypothetical protein M1818_004158 [Claussenomyces sp. TS43310]|nr:MAG: hypothetical protein M1818_004158 [Claussenomyces sp. TS43310]